MKLFIALLILAAIVTASGCSAIGADSLLEDPANVPDNVAMCRMLEGDIVVDGVYSNSQGSAVSLIEVNGGCANVQALKTPQNTIQLK